LGEGDDPGGLTYRKHGMAGVAWDFVPTQPCPNPKSATDVEREPERQGGQEESRSNVCIGDIGGDGD
jgi:hypothetical protein